MTTLALHAEARVETDSASKYLQQLCKHFQHKLPATFDAEAGAITFPFGEVKLAANAQALVLATVSSSREDLDRLNDVVARHLVRFAFREELAISWTTA